MPDQHIKNIDTHLARLQWACRRGMLELDVLLGNFLKGAYSNLPETEKQQFESLLDEPDPLLFAWLTGQKKPEDESMLMITEKIRNYAKSQF